MKTPGIRSVLILALAGVSLCAQAEQIVVTIHRVNNQGIGESIGTVMIRETPQGLLFTPNLVGLTPGEHGFHIHEQASCAAADKDGVPVAALAAGGHYDPAQTHKHEGPQHEGHLGDLPVLVVDDGGNARTSVLAPRLTTLAQVKGHALMIHAGGDNYADSPAPLGGGGARVACGVIR